MPDLRTALVNSANRVFATLPNAADVTVRSIDADSGATLATATAVTANRSQVTHGETPVGEGVVPNETCRFRLIASEVSFDMKPRDQIVEADGTTWTVTTATLGVLRSRWICEAVRTRS